MSEHKAPPESKKAPKTNPLGGGGSDSRNAKQTQGKKGNGAQKLKQKKS